MGTDMHDAELRLKCLELGMTQAKNENRHGDVEGVVNLASRFYTFIVGSSEPKPEPVKGMRGRRPKDKSQQV